MPNILDLVDVQELRNEVQKKYRDVAENPEGNYHFHTGRKHAVRLGYDRAILDQLPDEAARILPTSGNAPREPGLASTSLVGRAGKEPCPRE